MMITFLISIAAYHKLRLFQYSKVNIINEEIWLVEIIEKCMMHVAKIAILKVLE